MFGYNMINIKQGVKSILLAIVHNIYKVQFKKVQTEPP